MVFDRPPLFENSFRPKIYLALSCFLLLSWGAWKGWGIYQETQQKRWTETAEILFQKKDWRGSSLAARRALYLAKNPDCNLKATDIMARICREFHLPQEIYWRSELVRLQPDDFKAKEDLVQTAIRYDSLPLAQSTLESFSVDQRKSAPFHRLMAVFAIASRQPAYAEAALREALKLEPASIENRLNLAKVLLAYGPPSAYAEAQSLLDLLPDSPENRAEILRTHIQASELRGQLAEALATNNRLLELKEAGFNDRIHGLGLDYKTKAPHFSESLASLEKESTPHPHEVYQLASWLRSVGLSADAMLWLDSFPEEVRSVPPLSILWAECAVSAGEWARLENSLKDQDWGETDSLRFAFIARSRKETSTSANPETASLIQKSLALAKTNPALSLTLGDLFLSWTWKTEALDAWWQASRSPQSKLALSKLFDLYKNQQDLNGIWRVSKAASEIDSSDLIAKNNFAMTSLVLGNGVDSASLIARELYLRNPEVPAFASTYALSLFLRNKPAEAVAVFEKLPPSALQDSGIAPYYVLALAHSKKFSEAAKYRSYVQPDALFPEERALYEKSDRLQ